MSLPLIRRFKPSALMLLALALIGCSAPEKPTMFTGWFKPYSNCREQYAEHDARIDAAGVRDPALWRVPGYPYLRTDRMLASFRNEVSGLNDVAEWVRRMRELDLEARDYEHANLGLDEAQSEGLRDRFLNCGRILATFELQDPDAWSHLLNIAYPPDDYSSLQRALGLYPLVAPIMLGRSEELKAEALRLYTDAPPPPASDAAPLRSWRVSPTEDLELLRNLKRANQANDLGYPGLTGSQWRALAERYAPPLWIETTGDHDVPARPSFTQQGLSADTAEPTVYYQYGFTRFQNEVLVQIAYSLWFKAAPSSERSPIDGLTWRVTLDGNFDALLYESLHTSGADHRLYPAQKLTARNDIEGEVPLITPVPVREPGLRLSTRTHMPLVARQDDPSPAQTVHSYVLLPYENLYTLALPEGGTRSLFGPDGLVVGSRGKDPIGGYSSGIRKPGALRHAGRLAIAHVGRRHFDDPNLLDTIFAARPVSTAKALPSKLAAQQNEP